MNECLLKTVPFDFLTLRILAYQMIVRLFRFQSQDCEIVQEIVWSVCLSKCETAKVTGITRSSRKLCCHVKLVDAVEVNVGLNKFGLWLKELCGRVVLGGRNVWAFDVKNFWNNVNNGIWRFSLLLYWRFIEKLLFRNIFSENTPIYKKNYTRILSVNLCSS